MQVFGIIGNPLSHSFSKKYFNNKFEKNNLKACYKNFQLESISQFPELISENNDICGLNVTIPYKQQIIPYLTKLDLKAENVGAVNTIKFNRDKNNNLELIGFNTDVIGFYESLKPLIKPWHTKALILGTGGASKAVAYSFNLLGIDYKFVSRKQNNNIGIYSYEQLNKSILDEYLIIVNTTPLGTFPNVDDKPHLPYHICNEKHLFYDLVYNPEVTSFIKEAQKKGATVINGLKMLHLQAEAAWEIWNE